MSTGGLFTEHNTILPPDMEINPIGDRNVWFLHIAHTYIFAVLTKLRIAADK
jgi:hypothetical protein